MFRIESRLKVLGTIGLLHFSFSCIKRNLKLSIICCSLFMLSRESPILIFGKCVYKYGRWCFLYSLTLLKNKRNCLLFHGKIWNSLYTCIRNVSKNDFIKILPFRIKKSTILKITKHIWTLISLPSLVALHLSVIFPFPRDQGDKHYLISQKQWYKIMWPLL
jgi:hypothetical protein